MNEDDRTALDHALPYLQQNILINDELLGELATLLPENASRRIKSKRDEAGKVTELVRNLQRSGARAFDTFLSVLRKRNIKKEFVATYMEAVRKRTKIAESSNATALLNKPPTPPGTSNAFSNDAEAHDSLSHHKYLAWQNEKLLEGNNKAIEEQKRLIELQAQENEKIMERHMKVFEMAEERKKIDVQEIERLNTQNEDLKEKIQQLEKNIQELVTQKETLNQEVEKLQRKSKAKEQRAKDQPRTILELQRQQQAFINQISKLKSQLAEMRRMRDGALVKSRYLAPKRETGSVQSAQRTHRTMKEEYKNPGMTAASDRKPTFHRPQKIAVDSMIRDLTTVRETDSDQLRAKTANAAPPQGQRMSQEQIRPLPVVSEKSGNGTHPPPLLQHLKPGGKMA